MQKCVADKDWMDFRVKCNELLADGWKVIPGTVSTSTSIAMAAANGSGYTAARSTESRLLIAFFEK